VKLNHPSQSDIVSNPIHVAGYGNGFEGTIVVRVLDDGGSELAVEGLTKRTGDVDEVGEFYGDVELDRMPSQQTGVVEAWGDSGRGQEDRVGLVRIPVIFSADLVGD
jgi:hypothetical protein